MLVAIARPVPPCCCCGTKTGSIRRDTGLPYRFAVEQYGGPPGMACGCCRQRWRRRFQAAPAAESDGLEPSHPEAIRLMKRAWKRARAARLLGLAADLGLPWRAVRRFVDLSQTTKMRRGL